MSEKECDVEYEYVHSKGSWIRDQCNCGNFALIMPTDNVS